MYRILLVDDEPLILSGIKYLIGQLGEDFQLYGTARNGKQALELMEQDCPDIVVCDINMPLMSGLDLLKAASERKDFPAFVMLTNHDEFHMARTSLRYKAVDYLLKSQLDENTLSAAMERAKEYCNRHKAALEMQSAPVHREQKLSHSLNRLLEQGMDSIESIDVLRSSNILHQYAVLQILLDYSTIPNIDSYGQEDFLRLYDNLREMVNTLTPRLFPHCVLLPPREGHHAIALFCPYLDAQQYPQQLEVLYTQLAASCSCLTSAHISLIATDCLTDESELEKLLTQVKQLRQAYYLFEVDLLTPPVTLPHMETISADDLCDKLIPALRAKNIQQCEKLLEAARSLLLEVPHKRKNGVEYCAQLYGAATSLLSSALNEHSSTLNITDTVEQLNGLLSRRQLAHWLESYTQQLLFHIRQISSQRPALVNAVRTYVLAHIDQQIKLSDVASYVNMAPNYLSTTFRKQYGKPLFDFINEVKVQQACELIAKRTHKIYEVSYLLGYENAYYFAKVFKRYMGMTPREYQAQLERTE